MIKRELKEILDYLSELTEAVGPKNPVDSQALTPNDIDQVMETIRERDTSVRQWIGSSDRNVLLRSLIEISQMESFEEPHRHLKSQFPEEWDFHLVDLIYQACMPDFDKVESVRDELSKNSISHYVAGELTRWINDDE